MMWLFTGGRRKGHFDGRQEEHSHGADRGRVGQPPREGGKRASSTHDTKAGAEAAGRAAAKKDGVEHLIHKKDGTIGERNSYGNDPHPRKAELQID